MQHAEVCPIECAKWPRVGERPRGEAPQIALTSRVETLNKQEPAFATQRFWLLLVCVLAVNAVSA